MAYVSKEKKAKIADLLKAEFGKDAKKRGFKYSLAVQHHSTIVLTISQGSIDFIGNHSEAVRKYYERNEQTYVTPTYIDVNPYSVERAFSGKALKIIKKIIKILNTDNFDHSDSMTDYFHVGHYVSLHIGRWNKPYQLLG